MFSGFNGYILFNRQNKSSNLYKWLIILEQNLRVSILVYDFSIGKLPILTLPKNILSPLPNECVDIGSVIFIKAI